MARSLVALPLRVLVHLPYNGRLLQRGIHMPNPPPHGPVRRSASDRVTATYYSPKAYRSAKPPLARRGDLPGISSRWVGAAFLLVGGFVTGYYWDKLPRIRALMPPVQPVLSLGVPSNMPVTGVLAVSTMGSMPGDLAPVKVTGQASGTPCIFELGRWDDDRSALRVFVRGGETAEAFLPLGQYRGTITCGDRWYGAAEFGPSATVDRVMRPIMLVRSSAQQLQGVAIQLTRRTSGNLPTVRF